MRWATTPARCRARNHLEALDQRRLRGVCRRARRRARKPCRRSQRAATSTPSTWQTLPSRASSPRKADRGGGALRITASAIATAIGRSRPLPSFRNSAGARLTVSRRRGNSRPLLRIAERTRSRASLTEVAAMPTSEERDLARGRRPPAPRRAAHRGRPGRTSQPRQARRGTLVGRRRGGSPAC